MRSVLSVLLAGIFLLQADPDAGARILPEPAPQEQPLAKSSLKQRVLEIPPESKIQIRLNNKERLSGRLGQVTEDGFVVKIAEKGKTGERTLAFSDVKSINVETTGSRGGKVAAWIIIGAIAGVVIFILALRYSISHQG